MAKTNTTTNLDHYGYDWAALTGQERVDYLNRWRTPNAVVMETNGYKLRCFRGGFGPAVLIDPPCSGHDSKLADWDKGQSLVECALKNTNLPVYVIDYKSYKKEYGHQGYSDIIDFVVDCIEFIPGRQAHIVSLCQSGPIGAIIAAQRPELVASLTVAGAPINPKACESILEPAIAQPMWLYESVTDMFSGVMPGRVMLNCWMSSNIQMHYFDRFKEENQNDYRSQRFQAWYYHSTLDLAAGWYLEVVDRHFKRNDIFEGRYSYHGRLVDLTKIKCPVNAVYGEKDEISPKLHAIAIRDKAPQTKVYSTPGGHIGCFQSRRSIAGAWTEIFSDLPKGEVPDKPSVNVRNNSFIYDGAVFGEGAEVHKASFIYPGAVVGAGATIKNGCLIEGTAIVPEHTVLQSGTDVK